MAAAEQLGVMVYSPLGGGLLTGKYGVDCKPRQGRLVESERYQIRYGESWMYRVAERFTQYARERGYQPAALAVSGGHHPAVTAPIIGAAMPASSPFIEVLEIQMTPKMWQEIAALSPAPPPATDRTEEDKWEKFPDGKRSLRFALLASLYATMDARIRVYFGWMERPSACSRLGAGAWRER
jgi:hypothetical protein